MLEALLPPKHPSESLLVTFDFVGLLVAPASAVVTITAITGADPDAALMLDGTPIINGTVVSQRVKLGVDRVNYRLVCEATQTPDVRVRAKILPVRAR